MKGDAAADCVDALKSYSRRIGEYPFAELDLLATRRRRAHRVSGLIVVAEGLSQENPEFYAGATAHEARINVVQLVGNDQVDERGWTKRWRSSHGYIS